MTQLPRRVRHTLRTKIHGAGVFAWNRILMFLMQSRNE